MEPENNIAISGDEARLLLQAMTSQGTAYAGPMLPLAATLMIKLQNISVNQPPTVTPPDAVQLGENHDADQRP